jgi:predicted transcriptional regulator
MTVHRTQEQTRQAIIDLLVNHRHPMTRAQIAGSLGRKKSPFLITVLERLVNDGVLARDIFTYHNGVEGYVYALKQGIPQQTS